MDVRSLLAAFAGSLCTQKSMMQSSSQCAIAIPPYFAVCCITPQMRPSSMNKPPEADVPENVVNILNDETPPEMASGISSSTSNVAAPVIIACSA